MPLILEPERWAQRDLIALAEGQQEGLLGTLELFEAGKVPPSAPANREAAIELLRATAEIFASAKRSEFAGTDLARLVNLQYQAMITVTVLVPPTVFVEHLRTVAARKSARPAAGGT